MSRRRAGNAVVWILFLAGSLFIFAILIAFPFGGYVKVGQDPDTNNKPIVPVSASLEMKTFAGCEALSETITTVRASSGGYYGRGAVADAIALGSPVALPSADSGPSNESAATDFTKTNVQVEGVDEADIIKTDSEYLYLLTRGIVRIIDINPVEDARVVAEFSPTGRNARDLYIYGDRLVVFGSMYLTLDSPYGAPAPAPELFSGEESIPDSAPGIAIGDSVAWPGYGTQMSVIDIFDISDRENPVRERTLEFEGNMLTSRRIDGIAYVVLQSWPQAYPFAEGSNVDGELLIPRFREVLSDTEVPKTADGLEPIVGCSSVDYIEPIIQAGYLTIVRIPIDGGDVNKRVILGAGSTVFASSERLYVAGVDWTGGIGIINAQESVSAPAPIQVPELTLPSVPEITPVPVFTETVESKTPVTDEVEDISLPREETVINGFSLGENIDYLGSARVPGSPLNQFSMDEYKGAFRIATTENRWGRGDGRNGSVNALYTLDADSLERLGQVEDIAQGESIFSVRFLGERAYMVTFKKVDPLFVFDLADPRNPRILGKLKIPGFSDYLHPFNAEGTMIIGVGKNAEAVAERNFAWYQGMKLALFDAREPANPVELYKIDIGDRGTNSQALRNHKAFMYDPTRNLLVLPITLAEIPDEIKNANESTGSEYGSFTYQGAFIYELTEENGFKELGRVTHFENPDEYFLRTGFYPGGSNLFIERTTRVGDVLWTISNGAVLGSDLSSDTLATVAEVRFAK